MAGGAGRQRQSMIDRVHEHEYEDEQGNRTGGPPLSPLLHKLLWLLAHASILLGRPPAQLGAPPEHAPVVYRAAALALQLLQLLLLREAPLAEKLGRMRASHERVRKWACWRPEQAEALARLHSELWRAMPPAGSPAGERRAASTSR